MSQQSGGVTEADGVIYGTTLDKSQDKCKGVTTSGRSPRQMWITVHLSWTKCRANWKVSQPSGGITKADGVIYGTSTLDEKPAKSCESIQPVVECPRQMV